MHRISCLFLSAVLLLSQSVHGQQPPSAYQFEAVYFAGMTVGGHTFTPGTTIDSVALSPSGRCIFLARWHDATKGDQAAIFARNRIVVSEGDTVDGKFIAFFPKHARIAVNDDGTVAYEAFYAANRQEAELGLDYGAIFVEDHLVFSTQSTAHDGVPDFVLTEEGIVKVAEPNKSTSPQGESNPTQAPAKKKPGIFDKVHIIPPKLLKGFALPSLTGVKAPLAPFSQQPGELKAHEASPAASCPSPDFPLPLQWSASPGLASRVYEPPVPGRLFTASIPYMSGPYTNTFRVIYFGADCLPALTVLGDSSLAGIGSVIAVYSAHGLVTNVDPDGYLDFDGPSSHIAAETDAFTRRDSPLCMNAGGDLLFGVKWGGQSALLLATPLTH